MNKIIFTFVLLLIFTAQLAYGIGRLFLFTPSEILKEFTLKTLKIEINVYINITRIVYTHEFLLPSRDFLKKSHLLLAVSAPYPYKISDIKFPQNIRLKEQFFIPDYPYFLKPSPYTYYLVFQKPALNDFKIKVELLVPNANSLQIPLSSLNFIPFKNKAYAIKKVDIFTRSNAYNLNLKTENLIFKLKENSDKVCINNFLRYKTLKIQLNSQSKFSFPCMFVNVFKGKEFIHILHKFPDSSSFAYKPALIIDTSGSMKGNLLLKAIKVANKLKEQLHISTIIDFSGLKIKNLKKLKAYGKSVPTLALQFCKKNRLIPIIISDCDFSFKDFPESQPLFIFKVGQQPVHPSLITAQFLNKVIIFNNKKDIITTFKSGFFKSITIKSSGIKKLVPPSINFAIPGRIYHLYGLKTSQTPSLTFKTNTYKKTFTFKEYDFTQAPLYKFTKSSVFPFTQFIKLSKKSYLKQCLINCLNLDFIELSTSESHIEPGPGEPDLQPTFPFLKSASNLALLIINLFYKVKNL